MIWFVSGVVALMAMATVVDHLVTRREVREWQLATAAARQSLTQLDARTATLISNDWFLGLFDAIYDSRFWSLRRLIRSSISSLFAVFFISLLVGW